MSRPAAARTSIHSPYRLATSSTVALCVGVGHQNKKGGVAAALNLDALLGAPVNSTSTESRVQLRHLLILVSRNASEVVAMILAHRET